MQLISKLENATEQERIDFVIEYNHNQGYEIKEEITNTEEVQDEEGNTQTINTYNLEAWGYTEEELAQFERERIAKLKLTKREVFLGLFQAKGITPDIIKAQIQDPQALIEFEYANDYYRGNPLIDIIGASLGISSKQLDKFFETNDYTALIEG